MPKTKKEKGPPPLEDLPRKLRLATVRVMVKYNLDVEEAYEKIAVLADTNSRIYDEDVEKRSESKYKSRLFKQMNSARGSIQRTANSKLNAKYKEGYEAGYQKGKNDNAVYYYCNVCKKHIYITPNDNAHQAVVDLMYENRWGHTECHDKNP